MATLAKNFSPALQSTTTFSLSSQYDQFIERIKFSYYGIITMTMIIGSCLGGIATMYVFQNEAPIWQFCLVTAISMANNVAAISQAPMKWVVNIFAMTVIVNAVLILVNLG